jgi:hypothetical protein
VAHGQVVLEKALVREAQVDLSLEQGRINSQDLLEVFRGASKLPLLHGFLAGAEQLFDVGLGRLASCASWG